MKDNDDEPKIKPILVTRVSSIRLNKLFEPFKIIKPDGDGGTNNLLVGPTSPIKTPKKVA